MCRPKLHKFPCHGSLRRYAVAGKRKLWYFERGEWIMEVEAPQNLNGAEML